MKVKETLKSKFKEKVEVIPPKRRKAENQYRENLYKKGLPEKKLSRKEKRKRWNASVDEAFAASKGY